MQLRKSWNVLGLSCCIALLSYSTSRWGFPNEAFAGSNHRAIIEMIESPQDKGEYGGERFSEIQGAIVWHEEHHELMDTVIRVKSGQEAGRSKGISKFCTSEAEEESSRLLGDLGKSFGDHREGLERCNSRYKSCLEQCKIDYREPAEDVKDSDYREYYRLHKEWHQCNKVCGKTLACCVTIIDEEMHER